MADWDELAQQGFTAASWLRSRHFHRACVSRAYYAAFAKVTEALIHAGQAPRADYGTWPHETLPRMASSVLLDRGAASTNLSYALDRLYRLRLMADYQPLIEIDDRAAFEATGLMSQMFRQLS